MSLFSAASDGAASLEASPTLMDGSMVSRLFAAVLPAFSTSAKGARCLGSSVMGAGLAADTPMSGRTMGRRDEASACCDAC